MVPLFLCTDMNECENSRELCGEAMCENVEGTFLCLCHNENEEFDPATFQCVPRRMDVAGKTTKTNTDRVSQSSRRLDL